MATAEGAAVQDARSAGAGPEAATHDIPSRGPRCTMVEGDHPALCDGGTASKDPEGGHAAVQKQIRAKAKLLHLVLLGERYPKGLGKRGRLRRVGVKLPPLVNRGLCRSARPELEEQVFVFRLRFVVFEGTSFDRGSRRPW